MTQNETIDPATLPKPTFPPTEGLSKIAGKEVTVTGFTHNRGKPNESTDASRIGPDGLTDYYILETAESFDLDHKDKGVTKINHFYSTPHIHKLLSGWFGGTETNGKRFGPVKAVKRAKKDKPRETFWTLATRTDADWT